MAADDIKQTSEQQMRTLQFNDKVSRLNREFIRQLEEWYKQCNHYDFSNSVKSYLKHMKRLDEMYSGKPMSTPVISDNTTSSGRVIAKAKRRIGGDDNNSKLNNSVNISTPLGAPPRFNFRQDISMIKPNLDGTPTMPTPKASEPSATGSAAGGRKRAIRGGGPAGGAETVVFRGTDSSATLSSSTASATTTLPKLTPGFWSSQKKDGNTNDVSKPTFSFGQKTSTKEGTAAEEEKSAEKSSTPSSNGKGTSSDETTQKPTLSFPSFGTKASDNSSEKKPTLSFPSFGSKQDSPEKRSTPSSSDVTNGSSEKKTLTFPSFGNSTSSTAPSGGLQFSFGTLPKSSTEGDKGDEDGEYVPPKVEVVETEEAGATFSSKCSVFKLVDKQYTKLGVGMLHLKEIDGKKSVLVRAATAIGTVWLNALMNSTMKVAKADDKGEKLRLTCPTSEKEISTFVVRFPSTKEASKVLEEIEAAAK
ncbi:hypothetical protein Q1695_015069 [Nippostrongylus brasiliensis]|nr:hypothetical protein Q1695_015069 [Nippostrongylus brasiliensis]